MASTIWHSTPRASRAAAHASASTSCPLPSDPEMNRARVRARPSRAGPRHGGPTASTTLSTSRSVMSEWTGRQICRAQHVLGGRVGGPRRTRRTPARGAAGWRTPLRSRRRRSLLARSAFNRRPVHAGIEQRHVLVVVADASGRFGDQRQPGPAGEAGVVAGGHGPADRR